MPKSNFNQFLDECVNVEIETFENQLSTDKISFELKSEDVYKCKNQNGCNDDVVKKMDTFSCSSSNIFLSKNENSRSNIFLTNKTKTMNVYRKTNATNNNATNNNATNNNATNNIFKRMDDMNKNYTTMSIPPTMPVSVSTRQMSTPSVPIIEINNETFPSLTSGATPTIDGNKIVPKKIKNFKDAVCATASASVPPTPAGNVHPSPRVLPISTTLPPVIKRDSEIYAKKMLIKTNTFGALYDDDDDDCISDEDICNRNYRCAIKPTLSKRRFNKYDYSDDSD